MVLRGAKASGVGRDAHRKHRRDVHRKHRRDNACAERLQRNEGARAGVYSQALLSNDVI